MICSNCGKAINDDSVFCAYCGAKVQQLCGSCGVELMPGAVFCSKCGAAVGGKPASQPVSPAAEHKEPFFKKSIEENKESAKQNYITTSEGKRLFGQLDGYYYLDFDYAFWNENKACQHSKKYIVYFDNIVREGEKELSGYPVILDPEGKFVLKMDKQRFHTDSCDHCWNLGYITAGCLGNKEYYLFTFEREKGNDTDKTYLYSRSKGSSSPASFVREYPGFFSYNIDYIRYFNGKDSSNFDQGTLGFMYNGKDYLVLTFLDFYDPEKETKLKKTLVLSNTLELIAELPVSPPSLFVADGKLYADIIEEDKLEVRWETIRCLNDNKVAVKVNLTSEETGGIAESILKFGNTYVLMSRAGRLITLSGKEIIKPGEFLRYFTQKMEKHGVECPPRFDLQFCRDNKYQNNPSAPANSFFVQQQSFYISYDRMFYFAITMNGEITGPYVHDKEGRLILNETFM